MDVYLSEEEQLKRIKEWWNKHGNYILTVVIIVLAIIVGFQTWKRHKIKISNQASIFYAQMLDAQFTGHTSDFNLYANMLIKNYSSTPYASFAKLFKAKEFVISNQFKKAESELKSIIKNGNNILIVSIAKLRLARILIGTGRSKQAISILNGVNQKSFYQLKYEYIGDAYLMLKNKSKALVSYKKALKLSKHNMLLSLKISNIK